MKPAELRGAIDRQKEMGLNSLILVIPRGKSPKGERVRMLGQLAPIVGGNDNGYVVAFDVAKLDRWLGKRGV